MESNKTQNQIEIFCLMASSARKSYQLDTINMICYPSKSQYRLRYRKKYIENLSINLDKLKQLSQQEIEAQPKCLFLFFDKKYVDIKNLTIKDFKNAFIPIRWIRLINITDTETFIQIEILLEDYFDIDQHKDLIRLIEKSYNEWDNKIDTENKSIQYFIYLIREEKQNLEKFFIIPEKYVWQKICTKFFEIDEFQKSIFLILRSIIDCKINEPISPKELEEKFYGFKIKPHKYYMIELAQYINEKTYKQIESCKFSLNITSEKIALVENEKNIKYGGPYIIYHLHFHTRRSFRTHIGLLGLNVELIIDTNSKKMRVEKKNNPKLEKNNVEKREIETVFPNITVPIKIPRSIKDLILPGLLFIIGLSLPLLSYILNNWFTISEILDITMSLIGSVLVALAIFLLASLKISN